MIQEKYTRDPFVTFQHGVGIFGYQTKEFTVIAGSGEYSFKNVIFTQMQFANLVVLIFLIVTHS